MKFLNYTQTNNFFVGTHRVRPKKKTKEKYLFFEIVVTVYGVF